MMSRSAFQYLGLLVCALLMLGANPMQSMAQDAGTVSGAAPSDPDNWDALALRTEQLLDQGEPSEDVLIDLRAELADQRAGATGVVERGSVAVRALQAQLEAIGPPPAEGETEAEAIAAQRATLVEALAEANAPVLAAQQALERAEVLIAEIDRLLRSRSVGELLVHLPSPLNPLNWPHAFSAIASAATDAAASMDGSPKNAEQAALANGWLSALLAGLGLAGLFGLHPVLSWYLNRALRQVAPDAHAAGLLLAFHLERLFVLLLSGLLIAGSIAMIGIGRLAPELLALPAISAVVVPVANWVGHLTFSPMYPTAQLIHVEPESAGKAVWLSHALGWALVAQTALEGSYTAGRLDSAGYAVLVLVLIAASASVLWLLTNLVVATGGDQNLTEGREAAAILMPLLTPAGMLVRTFCIIGVGAASLGYVAIAQQAIFPLIFSLGLIVLAMGLYRLLLNLPFIAVDAGAQGEHAVQSAVPLVFGVALAVALIPFLALIWGARVTDISEIWTIAMQGVDISGLRVSLPSLVLLILVFAFGLFVTHWLQVVVRTSVLPRTRADAGVRTAVVTFVGYTGVLLAAFIAASSAGIDLSNLALVAGALSVGIGFGLQSIVANFLSGLILLVERPIKEGDWIEVAGYSGTVKKIAVRSTRIETFDRHDVIIPNSDLIAGSVKNMTLGSRVGRVVCPVGVAYGSDVETVKRLLIEIGAAHPFVLGRPPPVALLRALGDSALEFELRCFIRDVMETITVKSDLLMAIHSRFLADGIAIPFPQRDIHIIDDGPARTSRRRKPAS